MEVSTALDLDSGQVSVRVRDSKAGGAGPELEFTTDEWRAFLDGAKRGEFDL